MTCLLSPGLVQLSSSAWCYLNLAAVVLVRLVQQTQSMLSSASVVLTKPGSRIGGVSYRSLRPRGACACRLHTSAFVSIRQHSSAYVSIRQHTSAYVSIRQHTSERCLCMPSATSAYVSIRQHPSASVSIRAKGACVCRLPVSIRQHTSAYVSIRQHTSAYVREVLVHDSAKTGTQTCQYLYFCTSKASKLSTFGPHPAVLNVSAFVLLY
jgi:hypothetical protein